MIDKKREDKLTYERTFDYIQQGIKAGGHTPVYKMHKYFARRPHNVFNKLVEHYSNEGDVVLDTFLGGGVSLFEGLSQGRKVVGSDINPLAIFVSRTQATSVDVDEYLKYIAEIRDSVHQYASDFFITHDRNSDKMMPVRWYEHTYLAKCPSCESITPLSNERKKKVEDKFFNGWYQCKKCNSDIKSVDSDRVGTELVSVTYKITTRETQETVLPDNFDINLSKKFDEEFSSMLSEKDLWVPEMDIPAEWDRQKEDCLHRKGVLTFKDFFTKRTALVMAYFLKQVKAYKGKVSKEVYDLLVLTFSATLRYTNNLTISTNSWQDGRPVAWAKHAYWISNQFVEVNPIEYIDKRVKAISSGLKFQKTRFTNSKEVSSFEELREGKGNFLLFNKSSADLQIPDQSVDLVLTDPPYGSNVQYGELSAFWLAWIADELEVESEKVLDLSGEILVQRKVTETSKTHDFYYNGLREVFSECFRVLKPGRPLVFTFNNKDTKVWLAVIKAAIEAGFVLEEEGVHYQDPIENYKNTAHTRYAGSLHGDFIYTFLRPKTANFKYNELFTDELAMDFKESIKKEILLTVNENERATTNDIFINVLRSIIPKLAILALTDSNFDSIGKLVSDKTIQSLIESVCEFDNNSYFWRQKKET